MEELVQLRQAGLKIAYMRLESGNDEVLEEDMINELKEAIAGKIDFRSEYLRGL